MRRVRTRDACVVSPPPTPQPPHPEHALRGVKAEGGERKELAAGLAHLLTPLSSIISS